MSRSFKIPIWKDGKGSERKVIRRTIRRVINNVVKNIKSLKDLDSYEIPNSRTVVNDYNYSDYSIDFRSKRFSQEERAKYSRK